MARSVRIEYVGANYHVRARGTRREAIFCDDDDRRFFLQVLAEACGQTGVRTEDMGNTKTGEMGNTIDRADALEKRTGVKQGSGLNGTKLRPV